MQQTLHWVPPPPRKIYWSKTKYRKFIRRHGRLHEDYYDDDISSEDEDDTLAHTSKRQKLDVECDNDTGDSVAEEENVEDADWLSLVKVKNNAQVVSSRTRRTWESIHLTLLRAI